VGDVLAEERPARLDLGVAFAVAAVAESAGSTELLQQRFIRLERRQVEHPPVAAAPADRHVGASRRQAVVAHLCGRRCGHRRLS
jgi:hypothetical protein